MKDTVRVAVIGLGMWGQNHALTYADYHRSELEAVCDLNAERAAQFAKTYGCRVMTDYRAVAADPSIDAVSVATPDAHHYAIVMEMLQAGKHVFVEKPFVTHVDEAVRLVEAAHASAVKTMVDFQLRWHPSYQLIKEALDKGELGRPVMGYIRLSDAIEVALGWLSWAAESGPQWFLIPHIADLMYWFFGALPEKVYAAGHKGVLAAKGIDTYDAIQALLRFPGGGFVTIESSWIVPNGSASVTDCQMALYGTDGRVEFDQDYYGLEFTKEKVAYPWVPVGKRNMYGKLDSFIYEPMRTFVDCLLDGVETPTPFELGLVNTSIIDACLRSIESGAPETLRGLDAVRPLPAGHASW
jgi:predicted dehydrogenase